MPDPEGPTMATRWPAGICKLNAEKLNFSLLILFELDCMTKLDFVIPEP